MKIKTAFIGLGVMGYPMAGHLTKGSEVCVYNRTTSKAKKWVAQYGGSAAPTPAAAAKDADFVFMCVGNDDDLREVTTAKDGVFATLKTGGVCVDHTTASAELARELYQVAINKGFAFLDAPVSGGESGAQNGILTIMVGGDEKHFAAAKPLMDNYARAVTLMGESGAGQLTKMVNQICVGGVVQGLAEAAAFAINAGLDAKLVFEVIAKGAAQSWQMENRYATMLEDKFDFGFAVDWMRKDLGLCLAEAKRNGSELPVSEIIDKFYSEIQKAGGGRLDTSSLIKRLPRKTGN